MKKMVLGILLATLAMYVWGALFWMSPLPYTSTGRVKDDAATGRALLEQFPESGTYFIPGVYNDMAKMKELHQAGPIATVFLRRAGDTPMSPAVFALGFLHELLIVALLAALLKKASGVLPCYGCRVCFVALLGFTVAVYANLSKPIWFYQPWGFHLWAALYDFLAWSLVGLILAAFVKPSPPPAASQAGAGVA